jgi:hypothetical protein
MRIHLPSKKPVPAQIVYGSETGHDFSHAASAAI